MNGEPATDKPIQLCVKMNQENMFTEIFVDCQNYTTDHQGSFTFKIAPPLNSTGLTLIVSYYTQLIKIESICNRISFLCVHQRNIFLLLRFHIFCLAWKVMG